MSRRVSRRGVRLAAALSAAVAIAACGKKGPPLAPLHVVAEAVKELTLRRTGEEVRIRFLLPTANLNGPGPVQMDRVEIYAVTVAPGAAAPPNRELLTGKYRVAAIPVKPAPEEGQEPPPDAAEDARPGPGEMVRFVETLTADKLEPAKLPLLPVAPAPAVAPTVPAPPAPTYPVRLYIVRAVTKSGRGGQPSPRLELPLTAPPAPPAEVKVTWTEQAIALAWTPPADVASPSFNVYAPDGAAPLNAEPLTAPAFEQAGMEFGAERCFEVRTVETIATIQVESGAAQKVCVTPKDTFAPAAPARLAAVATEGAMNLSWEANADKDLAGYLVLRGDAPGERLQPLTPEPISSTRYEDKTVRPGARYVYVVVAVDKAGNTSAQSNRVEETAR